MPKSAENMLDAVKRSLKKNHPKWSSEKISSSAYAIVQKYWQDKHGKPAFN